MSVILTMEDVIISVLTLLALVSVSAELVSDEMANPVLVCKDDNRYNTHTCIRFFNLQILMNAVHQLPITVNTSVPTLRAPTLVPAMMDMYFNQMDIHVNVEAHSLQSVVVSRHLDIPMAIHKKTSSVCGSLMSLVLNQLSSP